MKQQKKIKSLRLGKETVKNLDRDEQKKVRGGSVIMGVTQVPIFCKP